LKEKEKDVDSFRNGELFESLQKCFEYAKVNGCV
jgi:hypothetical protein